MASEENKADAKPGTEVQTQDPSNAQPNLEEQIDELNKKLENLSGKYEGVVKTNNTTQKLNAELKKQLKEKELDAMSAEDKAKALTESEAETRKRIEELEAREKSLVRQRIIDSSLDSVDLPLEVFGERIKGDTEAEIKEDVNKLKKHIDNLVEKLVKERVNKALSGDAPITGESGQASEVKRSDLEKMSPAEQIKVATTKGVKIID